MLTGADKDPAWACLLGPLSAPLPPTWDSSTIKLLMPSHVHWLACSSYLLWTGTLLSFHYLLEVSIILSLLSGLLLPLQAGSCFPLLCTLSLAMLICPYYLPVLTLCSDWELIGSTAYFSLYPQFQRCIPNKTWTQYMINEWMEGGRSSTEACDRGHVDSRLLLEGLCINFLRKKIVRNKFVEQTFIE